MDRLTQSSRLDLDANSSSALKKWCHWFVTFKNYIEVLDASLAEERRTNKSKALVNCISHHVFEYIADCDSYYEAITVIQSIQRQNLSWQRDVCMMICMLDWKQKKVKRSCRDWLGRETEQGKIYST